MIMKKLFFSLVALVIATVSYAQSTLVATLTHGDEIKMFYGVKALQQAHAAAVDGDIINLSGGRFEMDRITKGITIRGTGVNAANPTQITTYLRISVSETATERLSVEGCVFEQQVKNEEQSILTNAYFLKNRFKSFSNEGTMKNAMFVNCDLGYMNTSRTYPNSYQFINSSISGSGYIDESSTTYAKFINCIVWPYISSGSNIKNAELINCIIVYKGDKSFSMLSSSSSAWNCVACGTALKNGNYYQDLADIREAASSYKPFDNLAFSQNCSLVGKDIFVDSNPENDLTDEAKATYLGNDGTPVGRYGGPFSFSWTPTYPQITKMNVANKTTADGKLSVEIEVSATE